MDTSNPPSGWRKAAKAWRECRRRPTNGRRVAAVLEGDDETIPLAVLLAFTVPQAKGPSGSSS
jgi:hypothetical protein